jgi:hypothetical protein
MYNITTKNFEVSKTCLFSRHERLGFDFIPLIKSACK